MNALPVRDIDPLSIRLFLAALEEGSLAKAAARLCLVPSAVSKRMSEMEEAFGVPLLERGAWGARATPAGQVLAGHARQLLYDMTRMHKEMAGFANGMRGRIRLAVSVAALSGELPAEIQAFRRDYPQIEISLEEDTTEAVFLAVRQGRADLGIGSDFGHSGLQVFPYGSCQLAAALPPQHLLADRPSLNYAQLLPYEQIELNRPNGISALFERTAARARLPRRISARVSSHETICTLVARGMGVAVVPWFLRQRHPEVCFVPLAGRWARTRICIAVREADACPPALRALLHHLGGR